MKQLNYSKLLKLVDEYQNKPTVHQNYTKETEGLYFHNKIKLVLVKPETIDDVENTSDMWIVVNGDSSVIYQGSLSDCMVFGQMICKEFSDGQRLK